MQRLFFWLSLTFILYQCANPVAPTGGPRDERAPQVVEEKSTPNESVNFKELEIYLTFDEWVELNDAFNQIIVTPPLQENIDVRTTRNKGLLLNFNEPLRDSTTYTIYFGESVRDITERNVAENLRFVFSTGPVIDSLEVSGSIINSSTGQPEPDMLVMLYANAYDSIVYKERPLYFDKSDENGRIQIDNMKGGQYKVFALKDANFNYLYDLDSELIGFQEADIDLNDSVIIDIELKAFEGPKELNLKDAKPDQYGLLELEFNKDPTELEYRLQNPGIRHFFYRDREKLQLYYDSDTLERIFVEVKGEELDDTLQYRVKNRALFIQSIKAFEPEGKQTFRGYPGTLDDSIALITPLDSILPVYGRKSIVPNQPVELRFNRPIQSLDTSAIQVFRDTIATPLTNVQLSTSEDRKGLIVNARFVAGSDYFFFFPKGSIVDWYEQTLDSLIIKETANDLEEYGTLLFTLEGLDSTRNYLVDLIAPDNTIARSFQVEAQSIYESTFDLLEPGTYSVKITEDTNQNGRWDTGSYPEKRQPEQIYETSLSDLRANWELESVVNLKALQ
ncbi:MAG: Ig-like domain-containing protein [Bacteroidota bacterium]